MSDEKNRDTASRAEAQSRCPRCFYSETGKLQNECEDCARDRRTASDQPAELDALAQRIAKGRAKYPTGCTLLSLLDEAGEVAHAVNKKESNDRVRDELLDVAAVAMRLYAGEIDTAWTPNFGGPASASATREAVPGLSDERIAALVQSGRRGGSGLVTCSLDEQRAMAVEIQSRRRARRPNFSPPWTLYTDKGKPVAVMPSGRPGDVCSVVGWSLEDAQRLIDAANRAPHSGSDSAAYQRGRIDGAREQLRTTRTVAPDITMPDEEESGSTSTGVTIPDAAYGQLLAAIEDALDQERGASQPAWWRQLSDAYDALPDEPEAAHCASPEGFKEWEKDAKEFLKECAPAATRSSSLPDAMAEDIRLAHHFFEEEDVGIASLVVLLGDVRRETVEACARVCEARHPTMDHRAVIVIEANECAAEIRALLTKSVDRK